MQKIKRCEANDDCGCLADLECQECGLEVCGHHKAHPHGQEIK
jgi:hypothetical protein